MYCMCVYLYVREGVCFFLCDVVCVLLAYRYRIMFCPFLDEVIHSLGSLNI
jgi:hypothetical protein